MNTDRGVLTSLHPELSTGFFCRHRGLSTMRTESAAQNSTVVLGGLQHLPTMSERCRTVSNHTSSRPCRKTTRNAAGGRHVFTPLLEDDAKTAQEPDVVTLLPEDDPHAAGGRHVFTPLLEDDAKTAQEPDVVTLLPEDDPQCHPHGPAFAPLLEDGGEVSGDQRGPGQVGRLGQVGEAGASVRSASGSHQARSAESEPRAGSEPGQRPTDGSVVATRDRAARSGDITDSDVSPATGPSVCAKSTAPWISESSGTSTST